MAENNQRSYRDPPRWRDAEEQPRVQGNDPLAELARLIGQSVPMKTDRRPVAPERADDEVLHELADERDPAAAEYGRHPQNLDSDFHIGEGDEAERYESAARANPLPPQRSSRFRRDPDFALPPEHNAEARDGVYQEDADWRDQSADAGDDRYNAEYVDEYENEPHDDAPYDEQEADLQTGRRGGFVFVTAVFALAVLGTAGAFGYRAMFGTPAMPALPPIIKAEGGPTKIIPSNPKSQDTSSHQADAPNASSGERLVSREERPVDIPPPVTSTASRPVSTVPVFPDPPAMGGPGAIVGYSASPASSSPAISSESPSAPPAATAPAMTTGTAAGSSANQASPPPSAPPAVATSTAPGPKKIRTVTIHTDQSGDTDASSARPGPQSAQAGNQGSNAPLSLVPAASEAPAAPARPRAAPAQAAPPNKPANQTASAAPVAPAATGGGYAVQVSSQHSEAEAQSSFRDLQAKYPDVLGGRSPIIRRADLGAKGIYFRAMVGPFTSADQATELCSNLKAAGGSCLVQKN